MLKVFHRLCSPSPANSCFCFKILFNLDFAVDVVDADIGKFDFLIVQDSYYNFITGEICRTACAVLYSPDELSLEKPFSKVWDLESIGITPSKNLLRKNWWGYSCIF